VHGRIFLIPNKTIQLFYWGRISGPGGKAACDVVHTFPARPRRGGAMHRNQKLFNVFDGDSAKTCAEMDSAVPSAGKNPRIREQDF